MMKRYLYILAVLVLCGLSNTAIAQSVTSEVITFSIEDVSELFMPPELYVDIDFDDDNNNKILEAQESGIIRLTLNNKGGKSDDVSVSVNPVRPYKGLSFNTRLTKTSVESDGATTLEFPISAGIDIPTDSLEFAIKVSEPLGYDIDATLMLSTYEYQKAKMSLQGVSIIDAGKGLRPLNGNPDYKVQKGEVVKAIVTLQNIGHGEANNVRYTISTSNPNVYLMTESGTVNSLSGSIDNFLAGEAKEIAFRLSANNNYQHVEEYLPIYITVHEDKGYGDIVSSIIPIPLGTTPAKPNIVDIQGERDKLFAQQQTKVYSSSNRISSNIKIRDISIAPAGDPIYKNAIAIVIGAEKNSYGVAPAPYAARDAQVMAKYFETSMGIQDVQLITNEQVTGNALSDFFDPSFGYLKNSVKPGETDVFVYYSGHGMPDISDNGTQDVYLFPYDARKELVKNRGYSLNKLYADLNNLNAKSVTVILDACFSGSSRQTVSYQSENISNAKAVRITMPELSNRPWDTNPNFRLFTSSSGEQTSLGYDQAQSGLFTYFLAVGLQGEADSNDDGVIMIEELVTYVTDSVSREAKNIRGGAQTPEFFGNRNMVIEKIR